MQVDQTGPFGLCHLMGYGPLPVGEVPSQASGVAAKVCRVWVLQYLISKKFREAISETVSETGL